MIEVFADVVCPFTHVGLKRLVAHRELVGRRDVALKVRSWPLELVNGEPLSRELLTEEIAELRASVAADLFAGFDPSLFPLSSLRALALTNRAYRVSAQHGELVSLALRDALFEQGRDISDHTELAAIGAAVGVGEPDAADEAAVLDDLEAGRSRGVIGSPHFFVDSGDFFCPTLSIRRVHGHMQITFDAEGFRTFSRRCFEPDHR
ncbi:MAG: DsbA family protein [Acidimicrobiia bacterium]